MPTIEAERRYFIMRASDELCVGAADRHAEWAALVDAPSAQRDFYDYLMSRPVKQQITKDDLLGLEHGTKVKDYTRAEADGEVR